MPSFNDFKRLDILGIDMGFEFNESTRFKTWIGSILTCCALIAAIVISFMFGQEVYKREVPSVTSNQVYQESVINLENFKFWFFLGSTKTNTQLDMNAYLDFLIIKFSYNITTTAEDISLKLVPCDSGYFENYYNVSGVSESISVSLCPNLNQTKTGKFFIKNPSLTYDSTSLIFEISKCNPSKRTCPSDIDEIFNGLVVHYNYINTYLDNTNYSNPIKYFMDSKTVFLNDKFIKKDTISFTQNLYSSDNGWIFQAINNQNYIGLSNYKSDVLNTSETTPLLFYTIFMDTGMLIDSTGRSYMKVQDLLAKVGGIINAFLIITTILSYHYINFQYFMNVSSNLLDKSNKSLVNDIINNSEASVDLQKNVENFKALNNNMEKNVSKSLENDMFKKIFSSKKVNEIINLDNDNLMKIKISEDENRIQNINESNANHLITNKIGIGKQPDKTNIKVNNLVHPTFYKTDLSSPILKEPKFSYIEYLCAIFFCNSSVKRKYSLPFNKAHSAMDISKYIKLISHLHAIYQ